MVKIRYILVMVLMATASIPVFAGWKVVIDKNWCLGRTQNAGTSVR